MKTQAEISERLRNLEMKVDAYNSRESTGTGDLLKLAEEYGQIMSDFQEMLLSSDLDFLMQ